MKKTSKKQAKKQVKLKQDEEAFFKGKRFSLENYY